MTFSPIRKPRSNRVSSSTSPDKTFTQNIAQLLQPVILTAGMFSCANVSAAPYSPNANNVDKFISIAYTLYHCTDFPRSPGHIHTSLQYTHQVYNFSNLISQKAGDLSFIGQNLVAPIEFFPGNLGKYWWGEPEGGYYCLTDNINILKKHARLLHEAGVDAVHVDMTNHAKAKSGGPNASDQPEEMITQPFNKMLEIWHKLNMGLMTDDQGNFLTGQVPKIIPWVILREDGHAVGNPNDMIGYLHNKLNSGTYSSSTVLQRAGNKPVLFIAPYNQASSQYADTKIGTYSPHFWMQKQWTGTGVNDWNNLTNCNPATEAAFKSTEGHTLCTQDAKWGIASDGTPLKQIGVAAAYQKNWASNFSSAMPKFGGRTLLQQLRTAGESDAQVITISQWNEWISMRVPGYYPYNTVSFTDQYDQEYNRDIEPGGDMGDLYYQMLKRGITELRAGRDPYDLIDGGNDYANTPVIGVVDGINSGSNLSGWACARTVPSPIDLELVLTKPGQWSKNIPIVRSIPLVSGTQATTAVNITYDRGPGNNQYKSLARYQKSEAAIGTAWNCNSWGRAHRFTITLAPKVLADYGGWTITVKGVHPGTGLLTPLSSSSPILVP